MSNNNLQELEDQATELAMQNIWGHDAYAINMAILEIDQSNCAACTRLAKYYKVNDNIAEAKNMYLKALEIDPENRAATNNLYDIKKDQEENEAVEQINTIKDLLKEAQKAMLKSKNKLAAKLYAKAFSIEPSLQNAINLAGAYKEMGQYDKIEKLYSQLMKENPEKRDAQKIENEFKLLRRSEKDLD